MGGRRLSRQSPLIVLVRVFQISGVSLFTLAALNTVFLGHIGWFVNTLLVLCGVLLLWLSFRLWRAGNRHAKSRAR